MYTSIPGINVHVYIYTGSLHTNIMYISGINNVFPDLKGDDFTSSNSKYREDVLMKTNLFPCVVGLRKRETQKLCRHLIEITANFLFQYWRCVLLI